MAYGSLCIFFAMLIFAHAAITKLNMSDILTESKIRTFEKQIFFTSCLIIDDSFLLRFS